MAVLGGRRKKKKIESDNHLVAAFPTRRYKNRLQDLQPEPRLPPLSSPKLSCNSEVEQKASPDVEDEEGGREGWASPPLWGNSHRIEGTVPAVELWEGLFENGCKTWLIALDRGETVRLNNVMRGCFTLLARCLCQQSKDRHVPRWWIPAEQVQQPAPAHSHLNKTQKGFSVHQRLVFIIVLSTIRSTNPNISQTYKQKGFISKDLLW